jgi:hypothetical protein
MPVIVEGNVAAHRTPPKFAEQLKAAFTLERSADVFCRDAA